MSLGDYKFIDSHTHILPGIDDGSPNVHVSEQMIKMLLEQGIDQVFLTPHFYPHKETLDNFLERRTWSYRQVKPILNYYGMHTYLGAEVNAIPALLNNHNLDRLCVEETNYILYEIVSTDTTIERELRLIESIYARTSTQLILAHINRYPFLLKETNIRSLLQYEVLMQLNLEFLDLSFFKRRKFINYIKKGYVQFLGTDCHHSEGRRNPDIKSYLSQLKKYLTPEEFSVIK